MCKHAVGVVLALLFLVGWIYHRDEVETGIRIDGTILACKRLSGIVLKLQDDGHFLVIVRLQHQCAGLVAFSCIVSSINSCFVDETSIHICLFALWFHVKSYGMLSANDDTCERHCRHIGIGYCFFFSILQRGAHTGQRQIQLGNAILDGILYSYCLGIRIDGSRAVVVFIQESTPSFGVVLVVFFRHLFC